MTIKGDLDSILNEGGEWKNYWFSEVRKWEPSNVECSRATKISIYGVPCYVRNKVFVEEFLSDVGFCQNLESLTNNPSRFDVLSLMIFTSSLDMIRNKVTVCLNGKWIDTLIVEETSLSMEEREI